MSAGEALPDDASWKATRNRLLLAKMLDLETPVVNKKMTDFLLQDGVCEQLINFITRLPEAEAAAGATTGGTDPLVAGVDPNEPAGAETRPTSGAAASVGLKRAFRATMLFSFDQTESMRAFVEQRASTIAATIFDVFRPDSCGSFHHACHVLHHLLQFHSDQLIKTVGKNQQSVERYLLPMLDHVGQSPVAETLCKLVACPEASIGARWSFYASLSNSKFLLLLAQRVADRSNSPDNVTACADALVELTDRLAADPHGGELLLMPIGHCPELLDGLIETVSTTRGEEARPYVQRLDAARVLQNLAARSREPQLMAQSFGAFAGEQGGLEGAEFVRNQLLCVKDLMLERLKDALGDLSKVVAGTEDGWSKVLSSPAAKLLTVSPLASPPTNPPSAAAPAAAAEVPEVDHRPPQTPTRDGATALEDREGSSGSSRRRTDGASADMSQPVAHPGHYAAPPLSALRLCVVTLIADVVELEPLAMLDRLPIDLWQVLAALFFQYPHSDLFHAQFYRLLFLALRNQHDPTLRHLLQRCRFVAHLINKAQAGATNGSDPQTPPFSGRRRHRRSPSSPSPTGGAGQRDAHHAISPDTPRARPKTPLVDHGFPLPAPDHISDANGQGGDEMQVDANGRGEDEEEPTDEEEAVAAADADTSLSAPEDDEFLWQGMGTGPGGGTIIRICNAIRLQAAALPPSAYLRNFLQSHESWRQFLPRLVALTVRQQQPGLGRRIEGGAYAGVPQRTLFDMGSTLTDGFFGLSLDVPEMQPGEEFGIDQISHGSDFAREMGFEGEVEWVAEEAPAASRKNNKRKRAKKKAKKKHKAGAVDGEHEDGGEC